ncbi:MAG: ATP-dependent DNA ligase [Cyclobacteriaceae bacterium]
MKEFSQLIKELEQTTQTTKKVKSLVKFFETADAKDKVWAIALFSHKRPKRQINSRQLREWVIESTALPDWLFEESYHVVGDLAETLALVTPDNTKEGVKTLDEWINYLFELKDLPDETKKGKILEAWDQLDTDERFIFNKLITGGFRIGVSKNLVIKALAKYTGDTSDVISHRLMGNWDPFTTDFDTLVLQEKANENDSKPYPFYLAYPIEKEIETLGDVGEWSAEWKWDGIRSQLIKRSGEWYLWSRGEELITDKFPEFADIIDHLPDGTVIDGELLPYKNGIPLDFSILQTRIGRKNLTKKIREEAPPAIIAYDLLEWKGEDIRNTSFEERRKQLSELLANEVFDKRMIISEMVPFDSWEELAAKRETSRENYAEGFMLKRMESVYKSGRKRGDWYKWKIDPMTIDAVMIYAQKGHGRRADLFSDYTFAVWKGEELVTFTKAYSGLTDKEMQEVSNWVKKNTIEKFGPVRTVKPTLVFELAFEGIQESKRHKSGIALRFPRIKRWRKDKKIEEANTLEDLKQFLYDNARQ